MSEFKVGQVWGDDHLSTVERKIIHVVGEDAYYVRCDGPDPPRTAVFVTRGLPDWWHLLEDSPLPLSDAMRAMATALTFARWLYDADNAGRGRDDLSICKKAEFHPAVVRTLRRDLIRHKLAELEAKRAQPTPWNPEDL